MDCTLWYKVQSMYEKVNRWLISSGIAFLVLALFFIKDKSAEIICETLLYPWFMFCKLITPIEWQTMGNIPLFLLWLAAGLTVYSVAIGAVLLFLLGCTKKYLKKDNQPLQ